MASISKITTKKGRKAYRIRIRIKGLPHFCISLPTKKEALHWVKIHEKLFKYNPTFYILNKKIGQLT